MLVSVVGAVAPEIGAASPDQLGKLGGHWV